jgi:tRNA(fMet)-specific endonuclease VapC
MTYLLDTNTCIRYLNGRAPDVRRQLESLSPDQVYVCSVVKAELFYGAMKSSNASRSLAKQRAFLELFQSLPFDDTAAEIYGRARAALAIKGTPIGPNDLMIAAIAHDLTLVTHNSREFSRIPDLNLEDWESTAQ